MKFNRNSGLYVIVDLTALGHADPFAFAKVILDSAPVFALQLRAKDATDATILAVAARLRELCQRYSTCFVLNDRPDLAVICQADGVHVGQEDLPLQSVSRLAPGLAVGHSTHTLEQLEQSLLLRPDYLALGPIFSTQSKHKPDPMVGLELLRQAVIRSDEMKIPLVAIGGITLENARQVRATGVSCAAVIGGLSQFANDEPMLRSHTRALVEALSG